MVHLGSWCSFFPSKKRFFLVWELDPTGVQQEESQEKENPDVAFWLAHYAGDSFLFFHVYYMLFAACWRVAFELISSILRAM
jgi:hypothetical protein